MSRTYGVTDQGTMIRCQCGQQGLGRNGEVIRDGRRVNHSETLCFYTAAPLTLKAERYLAGEFRLPARP